MEYEYHNYFGTIFSPVSPVQTVPACPLQIRAHHHMAVCRQQQGNTIGNTIFHKAGMSAF